MIEFTMEEAATVRFSTHQTKLKNMSGIRLNRPKSRHSQQDVSLKNTEYLLRCAFRVSSPPIESVSRFTRLTVEQTGLRLGFGFGTELKRGCSCAPKRDPFETSSPIPT